MSAAFLAILLVFAPCEVPNLISDAQKKDFIEFLKTLPVKGEFFTEEAIEKAGPYLPVLFALSDKDIEKYDIYPFLAVSSGLCDRKVHRDYAVRHFSDLRHPLLKLSWGSMLFDAGDASPNVVQFLREGLESKKESKILAELLGPEFEDFQRRVKAIRKANR